MLASCDRSVGETVESAYIENLPQILKYNFNRKGTSTVDVIETKAIDVPIDYIYSSYLKRASINRMYDYDRVMMFYIDGEDDAKPEQEVASSLLKTNDRANIKQDIISIIQESGRIGGYDVEDYREVKNRQAQEGGSGYIGADIGDLNLSFANDKGIVVAEVYKKMLLGAINLDKVLYKHLDESILDDTKLKTQHENTQLMPGKNYTEQEHHWDLAYGYYARWKPYVQPEGIIALRDSETKIFNAFVLGRYELGRFKYDEVKKHMATIREELSKVVVIRAMNLLVGVNTFANLDEEPSYSFAFISEAYGLIYALQFTRKPDGAPYFTYQQVKDLQAKLTKGNGLWDTNRLLDEANVEGSLKNIATEIGKPFGLTLEDIKR